MIQLRRYVAVFLFALLWLVSVGDLAQAGPLRFYGYDVTAMGSGNSQSAYGESMASLYSNPAILPDVKRELDIGFIFAYTDFSTSLMQRPSGVDVPLSYYNSDVGVESSEGMTDRPLPTVELPIKRHDNHIDTHNEYLTLSFGYNFNRDDLMAGLHVALPVSGMASIHTHHDNEMGQYNTNTVHFTRFGEWDKVFSLLLGLGYRPVEWISLGASLQLAAQTVVDMRTYVPDSTVSNSVVADTKMKIKSAVRPIVGVNFRPLDWFSFGVAWRYKLMIKSNAKTKMVLWNFHDSENPDENGLERLKISETSVPMVFNYEPMELSGSIGFQHSGFTGQAQVTWNRWVDFRDHHDLSPQDAAYFEVVNEGDIEIDKGKYGFKDTVSANFGLSYTYYEDWEVRIGGAVYPSPVPEQTGRTNFADNTVFMLSLGKRFSWQVWEDHIELELALQFWDMLKKTVHKDASQIRDEFPDGAKTILEMQEMPESTGLQTNNPGFPGYSLKGWEVVAAVSLGYRF